MTVFNNSRRSSLPATVWLIFLLIFTFSAMAFAQTGKYEKAIAGVASVAGALLGDDWSRLKGEEVAAWEVYQVYEYDYQNTSWWNPIQKLSALSKSRSAKKIYLNRFEKRRDYEAQMKSSGQSSAVNDLLGLVSDISGTIDEIGSIFGNKKSISRKNLVAATKAYEDALYDYESAGFFSKFGKVKTLQEKKKAYEKAIDQYEAAWGQSPGTGLDSIIDKDKQLQIVEIVEGNAKEKSKREFKEKLARVFGKETDKDESVNQDLKQTGQMVKDIFNVLKGDSGKSSTSTSTSKSQDTSALALKSQLDAANARYMELITSGRSQEAQVYYQQTVRPLMNKMDALLAK